MSEESPGGQTGQGWLTRQELADCAGITYAQVCHWQSVGLLHGRILRGVGQRGGRGAVLHAFSPEDVRRARAVAQLRAAGLSLQEIRALAEAPLRMPGKPVLLSAGDGPLLALVPACYGDAMATLWAEYGMETTTVPEAIGADRQGRAEKEVPPPSARKTTWRGRRSSYDGLADGQSCEEDTMTAIRVDRRAFLKASGLATGVAALAACGVTAAPTATPVPVAEATVAEAVVVEPTATAAAVVEATEAEAAPTEAAAMAESRFAEAPMLAERVAAGTLDQVDLRLPEDPLVVECLEEPGEYSGDLRRAVTSTNGYAMYCFEGLTRWDYRSGSLEIVPNIASKWDVSADGTEYTFYLLKGMRWSDGEPFTADDVMFWYEDIASYVDISPAFPTWASIDGEAAKVTKIDDYTVKFTFAKPYGIFLEYCAFTGQQSPPFAPKHYLKQFHPTYTDQAEVESAAKGAGFETWAQYFADRNNWTTNLDLPTVWPWVPTTEWLDGRIVGVRNPYYFKVDTNGKQLPYFDRLVVEKVQGNDIIVLKAMAGEIDLQASGLTFLDYSLLKESEAKGGYRVLNWEFVVDPCVFINHTIADEQLRAVFQNVKFRHALSHALNRPEMNDLLWMGIAVPRNVAPVSADPFYKPEFGQTAVEYDVDKANGLLDEAGLDKRDSDGYRLLPDGTRLELLLETFPTFEIGASAIDAFEQVASYWRAIGIMASTREIESGLWWERASGNQMQMAAYGSTSFLWIVDPTCFVPTTGAYWAARYADWNDSKGESGEEPPAEYVQLYDWYQQVKAEPDATKRLEPGYKIMEQCTEQVYIVGLCTPTIAPMIAKKDLVNVLEKGIHDWPVHRDMLTWPFQVWRRP